MIHPDSAIGLAGNILQFVGFTKDVLTRSLEVYGSTDGATVHNTELESVALSARRLTQKLKSRMAMLLPDRESEDESTELTCLSQAVKQAADELLEKLETLKTSSKKQAWGSIRQALRSVMKESELKKLEERLDRYRKQLDTPLLACLRKVRWVENIQAAQRANSLEIKNAISILIERSKPYPDLLAKAQGVEILQGTSEDPELPAHFIADLLDLLDEQHRKEKMEDLHESLKFPEMPDRYEAIPLAYQKTFEWIFEKSHEVPNDLPSSPIHARLSESQPTDGMLEDEVQVTWADFNQWLQGNDRLYWITGKPGAGKSTLMKFLCEHEKTLAHSKHWASAAETVLADNGTRDLDLTAEPITDPKVSIASFFFWNSGTEMQQSEVALLRDLLHQLISEDDFEMVPKLFPSRWSRFGLYGCDLKPFSWSELDIALQYLLSDHNKRFLLFIDGLDEFGGDCAELADYLLRLCAESNVKMCMASRPWTIFEEKFGGKPMLRIEDLSRRDILTYITGEFNSSISFRDLKACKPRAALKLIEEIANKASGVFLWVYLVVRSLLEGLRDGDEIYHLEQRLADIPADMEKLFGRILDRLNPEYAKEASQFFQFLRANPTVSTLPTVILASSSLERALETPLLLQSEKELRFTLQAMRKRLYSRCQCLLEVETIPRRFSKVRYIHRTANEWLQQPEVWERVVSRSPDYEPSFGHAIAVLLKFKSIPGHEQSTEDLGDVLVSIVKAKNVSDADKVDLVDEVDTIGHLISPDHHWLSTASQFIESQTKLEALWYDLRCEWYFIAKLEKQPDFWRESIGGRSMLFLAAEQRKWQLQQKLLEKGAEPNHRDKGGSAWAILLEGLKESGCHSEALKMIGVYLDHDADIEMRLDSKWKSIKAKAFIRQAVKKVESPEADMLIQKLNHTVKRNKKKGIKVVQEEVGKHLGTNQKKQKERKTSERKILPLRSIN